MNEPNPNPQTQPPARASRFSFGANLRIITIILLLITAGMLFAWKSGQASNANDDKRTVTVTGEAKVKAEPDEYVFSPSYEFKNQSKDTALAELTKKSDEITRKLKEIGVADNKIKSSSDGRNYEYYLDKLSGQNTYSLQFTITVDNKDIAQKVQDYLVSSAPNGPVSPQASFSDKKRKQLESQARDEATKDARAKADQSAKNLGFKVGKVKSVKDGNGFRDILPLSGSVQDMKFREGSAPSSSSLPVQVGENDLSYSVTVEYYFK